MRNHVNNVVCFFQLRQFHSVHKSLTDEAFHTLVHAFIASHVDYCNAFLYGVADGITQRLQSVLHAAAWLITGIQCHDHTTPTLCDILHWPPISQHITFKIALMMFDCFRGRCQKYFGDVYISAHITVAHSQIRSADHGDIVVDGHVPLSLAAAVSACVDQQFGTNFHRICKALTLGNSLNVGLRAGFSSVHMAGGESDGHWLKALSINGLNDLLTYLLFWLLSETIKWIIFWNLGHWWRHQQ